MHRYNNLLYILSSTNTHTHTITFSFATMRKGVEAHNVQIYRQAYIIVQKHSCLWSFKRNQKVKYFALGTFNVITNFFLHKKNLVKEVFLDTDLLIDDALKKKVLYKEMNGLHVILESNMKEKRSHFRLFSFSSYNRN